MKQAWEDLGTEYESSSSVLIGDADCTVEQELCQEMGVKGYPTIKYFPAGEGREGKPYQGGRDGASLKKFVEETLEVKCDVNSKEGCTDKEIKFIDSMKEKSSSDRQAQIARLDKMKGDKMKPELKAWVLQRLAVLRSLEA
mmetsp:Transcript_32549/g.63582  ORF Transcript_32549/g.63582 Transcript_32549/m.63582 type:complete len:141 (+) Transcript_32549:211-633(+)